MEEKITVKHLYFDYLVFFLFASNNGQLNPLLSMYLCINVSYFTQFYSYSLFFEIETNI